MSNDSRGGRPGVLTDRRRETLRRILKKNTEIFWTDIERVWKAVKHLVQSEDDYLFVLGERIRGDLEEVYPRGLYYYQLLLSNPESGRYLTVGTGIGDSAGEAFRDMLYDFEERSASRG